MKQLAITICTALLFTLGLANPAFAGEWREVPAPSAQEVPLPPPYDGPMKASHYISDTLVPGERIIFTTTSIQTEFGNYYDASFPDPQDHLLLIMNVVLTSGNQPITGFDGIVTWPAHANKDWISLYSPKDRDGNLLQSDECGPNGGFWNYWIDRVCAYRCYASLEDLRKRQGSLDCTSGKAFWIEVFLRLQLGGNAEFQLPAVVPDPTDSQASFRYRKLKEGRDVQMERIREAQLQGEPSYMLHDRVSLSDKLVVKLRHGKYSHITFDIDDTFRQTLFHRN